MDRRSFLAATLAAGALTLLPANPTSAATPYLRTIEVFREGAWVQIQWQDLKKGHLFRLREPDGTLADKGEVCIATTDARPRPWPEFYVVEADPYTGPLG